MTNPIECSTYKIQLKLFEKILFLNEIMISILEYSGNRMTQEWLTNLSIESNKYQYNKCVKEYINAGFTNPIGSLSRFYNALDRQIYDPINTIKTLSKCKCCTRHQIHRPTNLELYHEREQFDDWPNRSQKEHELLRKECSCICRHACRWICRRFYPETDIAYYTL